MTDKTNPVADAQRKFEISLQYYRAMKREDPHREDTIQDVFMLGTKFILVTLFTAETILTLNAPTWYNGIGVTALGAASIMAMEWLQTPLDRASRRAQRDYKNLLKLNPAAARNVMNSQGVRPGIMDGLFRVFTPKSRPINRFSGPDDLIY